jgi:uncharacterized protein (DUF983 family)
MNKPTMMPNQITAHNAGWPSQFRFADGVRRLTRMPKCHSCGNELADKTKTCPHCGVAVPKEFHLYQHPAVITLFLICCAICFGFLHVLAGLSVWLSAVIAIPIIVIFFAAMVRIASWSDCRDEHR